MTPIGLSSSSRMPQPERPEVWSNAHAKDVAPDQPFFWACIDQHHPGMPPAACLRGRPGPRAAVRAALGGGRSVVQRIQGGERSTCDHRMEICRFCRGVPRVTPPAHRVRPTAQPADPATGCSASKSCRRSGTKRYPYAAGWSGSFAPRGAGRSCWPSGALCSRWPQS